MIKGFIIVGIGSFLGGGLRYLFSQFLKISILGSFPLGTFFVNVLGCFLIGLFSSLPEGHGINASTKLLLTTGLCGGFTTFSTFIYENASIIKDNNYSFAFMYVCLSFVLGFLALLAGRQLVLFLK
jgi:protein CrcB